MTGCLVAAYPVFGHTFCSHERRAASYVHKSSRRESQVVLTKTMQMPLASSLPIKASGSHPIGMTPWHPPEKLGDQDLELRLREMASTLDGTERCVWAIVDDLISAGCVTKERGSAQPLSRPVRCPVERRQRSTRDGR